MRSASWAWSPASNSSPTPSPSSSRSPPTLLPIISDADIRPLRIAAMKPVGSYAYSIDFSDGHNTGIYTLESLRELGEA